MDTFHQHEIFEIETLELMKNNNFLLTLVFGGGTMLRLCHDLPRYSADLDFWFIKHIDYKEYFDRLQQFLEKNYDLADAQIKFNTLLFNIRSHDYPRRLKIEIRNYSTDQDIQDKIAFSKFATKQVILKTHTLEQTMKNKITALLDRKEIRDAFDIEFLLRRGIPLPELSGNMINDLLKIVDNFKEKDFKVTLGSVLESDLREYYVKNRFEYLVGVLRQGGGIR